VNQIKLSDDFYPTCLALQSNVSNKTQSEPMKSAQKQSIGNSLSSDLNGIFLATGSSDGRVHIAQLATGRIVKEITCHQGAITALQFSDDGSALLTASDDGQLKVWSGNGGLLRCTLATHAHPIHCAMFVDAPSSSVAKGALNKATAQAPHVAYTVQDQLILTSLAPNAQPTQVCVHRGHVLRSLRYCASKRLLLTHDECGCTRLFDLSCKALRVLTDSPRTSAVHWSHDGRWIVVASSDRLQLLSLFGQLASVQMLSGHSRSVQFDPLDRSIAVLQLDGRVCLLRRIDLRVEYGQFALTMHSNSSATFTCANQSFEQTLDFAGSFIRHFRFGYGRLLLILESQCLNYPLSDTQEQSIGSPASLSLSQSIHLTLIADKSFALIDLRGLCTVYDHQCRKMQTLRNIWPTTQLLRLNERVIALNSKYLILSDAFRPNQLRLFHADSSSTASSASSASHTRSTASFEYTHSTDIVRLTLAQQATHQTWCAAFLDAQQQLFLLRIPDQTQNMCCVRLQGGVVDMGWHEQVPILVTLQSTSVQVMLSPLVALTDTQLLSDSIEHKSIDTSQAQLTQIHFCTDGFVSVLCANDQRQMFSINHIAISVLLHLQSNRLQSALSLIQQTKGETSRALWSVVTGFALLKRDLTLALQGYVALRCSVKVLYLERLQSMCDSMSDSTAAECIRASELSLLCGDGLESAETHLLRGGLIVRLVLMHTQAFQWDRALALAARFDSQIPDEQWKQLQLNETDSVLQRLVFTYRLEHLERFEMNETKEAFKQLQVNRLLLVCHQKALINYNYANLLTLSTLEQMERLDEKSLDIFEQHQYTFIAKVK
jgi:intraflagellar transport protein 80